MTIYRLYIPDYYSGVLAYADGSVQRNKGTGGWGGVILYVENGQVVHRQLRRGTITSPATSMTAEMHAVIETLKSFHRPISILMRTDCQVIVNACTQWRYDWNTPRGKPEIWSKRMSCGTYKTISNAALWDQIFSLCDKHDVTWEWIKGHRDDVANVGTDALARSGWSGKPVREVESSLDKIWPASATHRELMTAC